MLENNHPRHTVRAQGKARLVTHAEEGRLETSASTDGSASQSQSGGSANSQASQTSHGSQPSPVSPASLASRQYGRLLNYLSANASQGEKSLLDQGSMASVGSSSTGAQMLEAWLNSGGQEVIDPLDEADFEGYWPKADYDSGDNIATERGRREVSGEHGPGGPGAFLRGLRARAKKSAPSAATPADNDSAIPMALRMRPKVEIKENGAARGERVETFPNGARVVKDAVGRVREITSDRGICVTLRYDDKGHLASFVRSDAKGTVHSQGETDGGGVLVRDGRGRVKAQGESMQVDARGCVSIARGDGQFWSLDLIRSVHTERRLLPDANGNWVSMTALFCSDGFRMTTRFRRVHGSESQNFDPTPRAEPDHHFDFSACEDSGSYRFYGRDGSIIDFDSDSELQQLKPSTVLPPGSKPVPQGHSGKRQAGTAWESLREYVFNYLAAL